MAWDSISVDNIAQPLDQIFQNKSACPNALFGLWMDPNTNVNTGGGEMTLCCIDTTRYTVSEMEKNSSLSSYEKTVILEKN
jgi:hypothetical protein